MSKKKIFVIVFVCLASVLVCGFWGLSFYYAQLRTPYQNDIHDAAKREWAKIRKAKCRRYHDGCNTVNVSKEHKSRFSTLAACLKSPGEIYSGIPYCMENPEDVKRVACLKAQISVKHGYKDSVPDDCEVINE